MNDVRYGNTSGGSISAGVVSHAKSRPLVLGIVIGSEKGRCAASRRASGMLETDEIRKTEATRGTHW